MNDNRGVTVWLTGLPCSGKSTLAQALAAILTARGISPEIFDGDVVRRHLSKGLTFSKEDRDTHIQRIGFVCKLLTRHGALSIVAAVSPYRKVRREVRADIGAFLEVHVDCPLERCEQRDVKGMYERARAGEIQNFTGIDDPYETPEGAEVVVKTHEETVEVSVRKIVSALERAGYLDPVEKRPA